MESITKLELGFAESLGNGFAGKEASDALGFLLVKRFETLKEFGGQSFLFGAQRYVVHGSPHTTDFERTDVLVSE
jgi:hypothetical protein